MTHRSDGGRRRQGFIGRYRLLAELASGGMGTVHLATMEMAGGLARLVALKRVHEHLDREGRGEMLLEEARLTARIGHPNVCTVFDFGRADGERFMVMEYLAGETVARIIETLAERPWAPEWPFRAAYLVAQAAEGLHAAHELRDELGNPSGLVHGDVSPDNLLVTYGGAVKVLDFGVAQPHGEGRASAPGLGRGKLAYAAPEQIGGAPFDRRADVWALGVVLWEMLALQPLFRREDTYSTLGAVTSCDVPAPSALRSRVPRGIDALVLWALSRDPAARPATARELGRALVAFCREHVEVFDPVEIEEFMSELFPIEQWRKRTMARRALAPRGAISCCELDDPADILRGPRHVAS